MQYRVNKILSFLRKGFEGCEKNYNLYLKALNENKDPEVLDKFYSEFEDYAKEVVQVSNSFGLEGKFFKEILFSGKRH